MLKLSIVEVVSCGLEVVGVDVFVLWSVYSWFWEWEQAFPPLPPPSWLWVGGAGIGL